MKRLLILAALAIPLCACNATIQKQVLENLQGCTRHYDGTVGAGITGTGFSGVVKIDCEPLPKDQQTPPSP